MTPDQYIAGLDEPRRTEVGRLDALIQRTAPQLERYVGSGMLAYGRYHYRYASGREGDTALIGLASRKQYISLYLIAADGRGYLAEQYRERLPKADVGKSCVRIRHLRDVDELTLAELIAAGAAFGGVSSTR
jgi:Domain of unknown function (DU1801)